MINLCPPAIIYLIFSITQMLIDLYNGLYNTAGMKGIVTIMVTLLLNILCERGLGVVSWIIVFIPFILMTILVSGLLYLFGLDAATGNLNCNPEKCIDGVKVDSNGNIIIYDPKYNPLIRPVYYNRPNIIVPNPNINDSPRQNARKTSFPSGSSDPAYQS